MLLQGKYFQNSQASFGRSECKWVNHGNLACNQGTVNPSNAEAAFVQSTRTKYFGKPAKPCYVGICWIALTEYSQMSTNVPGF